MTLYSYSTNKGLLNKKGDVVTNDYEIMGEAVYPECVKKLDSLKKKYIKFLEEFPKNEEEEHTLYLDKLLKRDRSSIYSDDVWMTRAMDRMSFDNSIPRNILKIVKNSLMYDQEYKEFITLPVVAQLIDYFKIKLK